MGSHSLTKEERLCKKKDFVNLKRNGRRYETRDMVIVTKPNGVGIRRIGIIVSKKIGKATKRNRIKRLFRECFRQNKDIFPESHDILFIAKRDISGLKMGDIKVQIEGIIW